MSFNITQIVNKMLPAKIEESAIALPVDIQGISLTNPDEALSVKMQQSDPVEVIDLLASDQIRSTGQVTINLPDLTKYVSYDFYVLNTLNQAVRIAPWLLTTITLENNQRGRWSTDDTGTDGLNYCYKIQPPGNSSGASWLSEVSPESANGGTFIPPINPNWFKRINAVGEGKFQLQYRCLVAPTSGILTIRLIGRLR